MFAVDDGKTYGSEVSEFLSPILPGTLGETAVESIIEAASEK